MYDEEKRGTFTTLKLNRKNSIGITASETMMILLIGFRLPTWVKCRKVFSGIRHSV